MQVLLKFHSSQVDTYIIKGEISSAFLQNILSDIEMVKKTQPTYFFPHSPQKIASKDEVVSTIRWTRYNITVPSISSW